MGVIVAVAFFCQAYRLTLTKLQIPPSMKKIVDNYAELPKGIRKPAWRLWHFLIQKLDRDRNSVFLNYGYAPLDGQMLALDIGPAEIADQYGIQLYDYVASPGELRGATVLEVGCGRGGGASWLARNYQPHRYIGMDISPSAVAFCNQRHQVPGLSFLQGNAENLPFRDDHFDAVVNVESARGYGDIPRFFREVKRVLKPGGSFLFADLVRKPNRPRLMRWLADTGLVLEEKENITPNVVAALRADTEAKKAIIREKVPSFLWESFYEFAGLEGSNRFRSFDTDEIQYWRFLLTKPQRTEAERGVDKGELLSHF
jgi:ubiquinone/menaquinone biosynthesis C-methylase UbiE